MQVILFNHGLLLVVKQHENAKVNATQTQIVTIMPLKHFLLSILNLSKQIRQNAGPLGILIVVHLLLYMLNLPFSTEI